MSKQDFVDRLRAALTGNVSAEQVQEHVYYYEDYINTQIRMGHGEEDVLKTLGDPRLIARTIIETSGKAGAANYEEADFQKSRNDVYPNTRKTVRIPGWLWAVIVIFVLFLIFKVIFSVLAAFAPLIFVMIIVVSLMKLFNWLN